VQAAAESSVAAPEPAGLEVVVTFASDGAPARDVGVYLRAANGGALGVEQRTDAAGIARFAPSDAGIHEAYVDRVSSPAAARWPEESSLAIEIPAGPRVEGRVVDLSGEGVAGALVLRRNDRHHDVLQRVAVADGEGRFALRDVEEKLELLARAPRHQPSELKDVKSRDGLAEVELRLGANGHALAGRVLMPGGDPAPFAWVLAGVDEDARRAPAGSDRDPLAKTGKPLDREGLLLRADAEGRFESDEIPGGHLLLVARSAADQETALLGWTTRFVAADVADELVVHLQPGGRITGIVRDATGMPVGGVALEAEWEGTRELGQMEDDLGPFVSDLRTVAAEDGSFRLGALLPGDYDLRVHGRYAELARHEQVLGVAEHAVWDPVVERPCALDVRVLDADGAPLSGWAVAASVDSGRRFHDAERSFTDERGLARLDDLPLDADVVVAAYPAADGACAELPAAWSTGVRVERPPTELVLRVASDRMPSASIRGRFLGADGAPVPGARVELALDGWGGAWSRAPDSDGRFAFAGLGAGRYVLRASTRELPRGFVLAEVDLAAGETLDVGG
jgi:protocatechuate 3,4-dioxygenase beta subunit